MRSLTFVLAAAFAVSSALAADAPATRAPRFNREAFQQMRAAHEKQRGDDIALLLGLTPQQRPALDAFLNELKPSRRMGQGRPDAGPDTPSTATSGGTLAHLDAMEKAIDSHGAEAKQRIAASRRFYASLTADQQRRFDALERLHYGHMGMFGRAGGPGGPGGSGGMKHGEGSEDGPDAPPPPPPGN